MTTSHSIRRLAPAEAAEAASALAEVLVDCVDGGASVGFMAGFTRDAALAFWRTQVEARDGRAVLVAEDADGICGVVQVVPASQPNQPHRADVTKMLVRQRARNRGLGEALMRAAEAEARAMGKTLLVLDTVEDSAGDRLYSRVGWTRLGVIPGYALMPDGAPCGAAFFYKVLAA
jgi:GNAT superfamily N-acetyltransferase